MYKDQSNEGKRGSRGVVKLSSLFQKYVRTLRAPERSVIDATCAVLNEEFGIKVTPQMCRYTVGTRTLTIQASGLFKSEIQRQREEILKRVALRIGVRNAPLVVL